MLVLDMIVVDWIVKEEKKKKKKNLQVLLNVFLMLWTLWGLGCDTTIVSFPYKGIWFMKVLERVLFYLWTTTL